MFFEKTKQNNNNNNNKRNGIPKNKTKNAYLPITTKITISTQFPTKDV